MGNDYIKTVKAIEHPTALGAAVRDPEFQKQGIGTTIHDVMKFFGLTQQQLHEFSCDCGGAISNDQQARRIEGLAR
jgi:RimJ/RimL family protein N-acetyltransferase